jgi:hypothetical protein
MLTPLGGIRGGHGENEGGGMILYLLYNDLLPSEDAIFLKVCSSNLIACSCNLSYILVVFLVITYVTTYGHIHT